MNVYVRQLARELGRMGLHVDVFTRSQNPTIPRVVELGPGRPRDPPARGSRGADAARGRPRATSTSSSAGVEAFRAASGFDYDLIHAHYWLSGVAGLGCASAWGAPAGADVPHPRPAQERASPTAPAELEPALRIDEETRIVAAADRIVAANVGRARAPGLALRRPADRIAVIPCGVDTDLFQPMDRARPRTCSSCAPEPLLLYVGRMQPIKGLDTLLEAMTAAAGAGDLLIVGGEHDEPENGHGAALRGRLSALGLERRVRFLGAQPQRRLPALLCRGRRHGDPVVLRVVRHGRARGDGVRQSRWSPRAWAGSPPRCRTG